MFPMLRSSSRQVLRTALNKAIRTAWIIKNSSRPLVDTPGVLGTALNRKRILTSKPDDHIISGRDPAAFLQKFLYDHPVWGHPDVHVYWKQPGWKHLQMKDYMVSSVQHLLVVKDSGKADHKKVAIYKFIAMHKKYRTGFLQDNGGNSIQGLKAITEKPFLKLQGYTIPRDNTEALLTTSAKCISKAFDKYGPGLVSSFQVDDNFQRKGTGSFLDDQVTGKTGSHAMILVGYRQDENYGYVFLFQNWWQNMEYVEVSAQYIAQADAKISFVTEPLTEIPKDLPVMDAVATEANDGGGGDKSMPEY